MTKAKSAPETTEEAQAVIVIGFDEKSKPRAARFAAGHAALATKAAGLMGLTVCPVTADLAELSKKLPGGRIYANDKGFVPNIRKNLFDKIVEAGGVTLPTAAPTNSIPPPSLPSSWDDIDVGKIVLACGPPYFLWEAIVTEKNDDLFT